VYGPNVSARSRPGAPDRKTQKPSYHPSVLLKLYVYGYLNRVQSSRRLEREAGRNVEVMWLLGRIARASVAIDGSKFKAVNNREKNFTKAKVQRRRAQLEEIRSITHQVSFRRDGKLRAIEAMINPSSSQSGAVRGSGRLSVAGLRNMCSSGRENRRCSSWFFRRGGFWFLKSEGLILDFRLAS
jgi:hypothetical protein